MQNTTFAESTITETYKYYQSLQLIKQNAEGVTLSLDQMRQEIFAVSNSVENGTVTL
jgi:hypothetical protein